MILCVAGGGGLALFVQMRHTDLSGREALHGQLRRPTYLISSVAIVLLFSTYI